MSSGRYEEAVVLLERAVRSAPFNAWARYLLGESQTKTGNFTAAIVNLEKAVRASPKNAAYHSALAHALMTVKPAEAIPHLQAAIELGSTSPAVFGKLVEALFGLRRYAEALEVCDLGLLACQEKADLLGNKSVVLFRLGQCDEAFVFGRRQLDLLPDNASAWCNLGNILKGLGRMTEAEDALRQACRLDPENAEAHYNLGLALLLGGQYREGFREYEWRWKSIVKKDEQRNFAEPLWDGSFLGEQRLLLHAEQGAGDTIQFARYVPLVEKLGGPLILEAPSLLVRLMTWMPGRHRVVPATPPAGDFAVHCPLLTLPLLFGTDAGSIPPPASFIIPGGIHGGWAQMVRRGKINVALVWAGTAAHSNDHNRSLPLRLLLPLLGVTGVDFFSLQMGPPAGELESTGVSDHIRDLSPFLTDFAETAAALSCMDLVISADTAVAHLAGSLGKPVWMFVPFVPDWRWLLGRDDSPWYPSMRLFRQKTRGDWDAVVQEMQGELRNWLQNAAPARPPAVIIGQPNDGHLQEISQARARLAADFIPAGATVADLGYGATALEKYLPYGSRYLHVVCNFNEDCVPAMPEATHVVALGLLETIHDWRGFLRQLCAFRVPVIFSYHPGDYTQQMDRAALGFVNHINLDDLCSEVYGAGFSVQTSTRIDNQVLLRIQPGHRRGPGNSRVLVLSGNRFGFHLINSLLPGVAEVHHANFQSWNLPPGDFDLVVVGTGNSLSEKVMTEELLTLVRRTPKSVGIFGTQYREGIKRERFAQLLDALTVWFARSEEDLLLYGKGRANAIHLGDWLIDAFPLTRWTRNETLKVGQEIWNDLPLDRTIQQIQQYRNVVSERLHPLLCALTSAERVAYSEQRESASGQPSGKFRGMLLDIFGRTWPESCLFEFRRECVADYRTKVQRMMAGMPQLFEELLNLRGKVS